MKKSAKESEFLKNQKLLLGQSIKAIRTDDERGYVSLRKWRMPLEYRHPISNTSKMVSMHPALKYMRQLSKNSVLRMRNEKNLTDYIR